MKLVKLAAAVLTTAALASCGGGGPVAGDASEMTVFPEEIKWTVLSCGSSGGNETTVAINGGQPPYRIVNSASQFVTVDRTTVTGKDPTFRVTTLRGCGENMAITVFDYHSRAAVFSVTIEEEDNQ